MESSEAKSRRRKIKIKKTRLKIAEPGFFTRMLGKVFGSVYLENYRPINIGILLVLGFAAAFILLVAISPPNIDFKLPPIPIK